MSADLLESLNWHCLATEPGTLASPDQAAAATGWVPVSLPGGVVAATARSGTDPRDVDIDGRDFWFRATLPPDVPAGSLLVFEGLATLCDVYVAGSLMATSKNMFRSIHVVLPDGVAGAELMIRSRSLAAELAVRRPRPRWKASIVRQQQLRFFRTTLFGRMPGVLDTPPAVGPWRPVRLVPPNEAVVLERGVRARLEGDGRGVVEIETTIWCPSVAGASANLQAAVHVGPGQASAAVRRLDDDTVQVTGIVELPGVERWWPHTHGESPLYPVSVQVDEHTVDLGRTGFRDLQVDQSDGNFLVSLNGTRIFCRGVCWVPPDHQRPATTAAAARTALTQLRDAGFNTVRLTGTNTTESTEFHDLCDELGMLVWQDCMIATLDLPQDDEFMSDLSAEVSELCDRLGGRPSVIVLSGGTETLQQPAMLGLRMSDVSIPAIESVIPKIAAQRLPGTEYVISSPSGGELPFHPGSGVAHYFGVGAYLRPLTDATVSNVRFAAECLAFAVPPERRTVDLAFGGAKAAGHTPAWKRSVPRDLTASWDFEDVRDFYVRQLFDVDPMLARYEDPERYLDLGRAACAEAMASSFSQWRVRANCGGAVILQGRDLVPGAGWGIVDALGIPKAPLWRLRSVLAPLAVVLRDDGMNGLVVDLHNDHAEDVAGTLRLRFHGPDGDLVDTAESALTLPSRSSTTRAVEGLLGYFRDVNHVFRFGPPLFGFVGVDLLSVSGEVLARDAIFPVHPPRGGIGLSAKVSGSPDAPTVTVTCDRPAQWVALDVGTHVPSDNWFHLAPGESREISLVRSDESGPAEVVRGTVRALNSSAEVRIEPLQVLR